MLRLMGIDSSRSGKEKSTWINSVTGRHKCVASCMPHVVTPHVLEYGRERLMSVLSRSTTTPTNAEVNDDEVAAVIGYLASDTSTFPACRFSYLDVRMQAGQEQTAR